MQYQTRIKLNAGKDGVEALCEILHPMESTNYITQVVFRLNNVIHAEFFLGRNISSHPVVGTLLEAAKAGDLINISWQDISGNRGQASAKVTG